MTNQEVHDPKPSRNWVFTLNNPSVEEIGSIKEIGSQYTVFGKEYGEKGTPHLQGYITFKNAITRSALSKKIPRAWLCKAVGSPEQNRSYCTKEGSFWEHGHIPYTSKEKGAAEQNRWEIARENAKSGNFEDIPADIYLRCYGVIKKIRHDFLASAPLPSLGATSGLLIYGPTGTGKSRTARERNPGAYIKNLNKWWDGYNGQTHVIIDDLDPPLAKALAWHIKIWTDHYPFTAETKGGSIFIRPTQILITTQYPIDELWMDNETRTAMYRRLHPIHIEQYLENK